ncbi:unnamed protein product [Urochloa humidicola]
MDSESNETRQPFGDLTNTRTGDKSTLCRSDEEDAAWLHRCNPSIHAVHHGGGKKESARNRQAARRAQMSQEQKDKINRKRRETRLRNKIQDSSNMTSGRTTLGNADTEVTPTMMDASNNNSPGRTPSIPLVDPDGHRKEIAITGAASRHAQLTREKKDEINKKRREARLQKKIAVIK